MRLAALIITTLALAGCATPVPQGGQGGTAADRDTHYSVEEQPGGFKLSIAYERYQFIPETQAVMASCKSALTALAYDVADKKGRKIEPINEQRIRISTGRNGLTGITSCEASVPAIWKQ